MKLHKKLEEYPTFKQQLIKNGTSFKCTKTNYTARIKTDKIQVLFSDKPSNAYELKLINLVRSDTDKYLANENDIPEVKSGEIDFSYFYDIKYSKLIEGIKVDIVSAYWNVAINRGILTDRTLDYFNESLDLFDSPKSARLKALGSLATRKQVSHYEKGELVMEMVDYNENWRYIYLDICREIARLMNAIAMKFKQNIIYYYWDCLFLDKDVDLARLVRTFQNAGYDVTSSDLTSFEIVKHPARSYLKDKKTGVEYPIDTRQIYIYD